MAGKQLIFIDDSGDPGFKKASSSNFVLAAVVFANLDDAIEIDAAMSDYRRSLGWRDGHEFKFRKVSAKIKKNLLKIIKNYDFKVYAVYTNKVGYTSLGPKIVGSELYDMAIIELLKNYLIY